MAISTLYSALWKSKAIDQYMKKTHRYSTSHLPESQFEQGSSNQVLKNKLGITSPDEMDKREKEEQLRAMDELTDLFDRDHRFTAADICKMHKMWLGNIYEWAGKYRQVKMSKGDFSFAFPEQIPKLMAELEKVRFMSLLHATLKLMRRSPKHWLLFIRNWCSFIPSAKETAGLQECWLY